MCENEPDAPLRTRQLFRLDAPKLHLGPDTETANRGGNIKKMGKAGYDVPGVEFEEKRRRAVRSL